MVIDQVLAIRPVHVPRVGPSLFLSWQNWFAMLVPAVVFSVLTGCASQVRLINETPTGGAITYPFLHEEDILTSSSRHDAIQLLTRKCPDGYRVLREGEIARINTTIDKAWNGQIPNEKIWKIQFECK